VIAPAPAPTPAPQPTFKIRPLFVKPVHLGSSIGITKAKTEKELDNAIEVALHYDDKVLVELGVENLIEVTLPMIGNDVVEFAAIERPLNKGEFLDYEEKYLQGGKKVSEGVSSGDQREIPAKIGDELSARVREIGEKTYKTLGCSGIARVDMLIDSVAQTVYMNEVNTLPGSLYVHNWRRVGISNVDLITKLIGFAEARFAAQNKVTHTFNSSILQKAGGTKTN
jgi:D-alanine-D-alanine ligase